MAKPLPAQPVILLRRIGRGYQVTTRPESFLPGMGSYVFDDAGEAREYAMSLSRRFCMPVVDWRFPQDAPGAPRV